MANKADLKYYTPDRWYYVQRQNGREIVQTGFHTEELARAYKKHVDELAALMVAQGYKYRPNITSEVVEAKGWNVDGNVFRDFHAALWCKWTEKPEAIIKGVF